MGRHSAASNVVKLAAERKVKERKVPTFTVDGLYSQLLDLNPHLTASEYPSLMLYVNLVVKAQALMRKSGKTTELLNTVRQTMAVARSMRLTSQSVANPDKIGRRRIKQADQAALDVRNHGEEDEED